VGAFNVINHVNFDAPIVALNSASFGQIQRTAVNGGDPRIMQFALKLAFDAEDLHHGGNLCGAVAASHRLTDDWPSHDHDAGGQRFSPLKQITPANRREPAGRRGPDTGVPSLQVTPLVVNGIIRHGR
jgi:hypothetical protein